MKRDGGFVREGYDRELDESRGLATESRRVILGLERGLIEETGIRSLKIRHNNVLGYYIEVTANHQAIMNGTDEAKGRFIHRQTMANAMRFTTTELAELESKIANAADRALGIELAVFDRLVAEAVASAEKIRAGAEALAVLDVSAALACLAAAEDYTRPQVDGSLAFEIEAGRHPVVEQALRRQAEAPFVANDCNLSPENGAKNGAIWLLTGPNMGGKSTFLRQNALIAILAQMGSYVPARSAHIGVVDRLFSRVGASDDLARGRSTFMVEMVETAAILNQASERSLVILDEIGRGTATFDGLSIAWAAVEYLHEQNRATGDLRHAFPRDDGAVGKAEPASQRHHAGEGVGRGCGLPARSRERCGGSLLRRAGGQARRPAGRCGRPRQGRARATRKRRDGRPGGEARRRFAAVLGRYAARGSAGEVRPARRSTRCNQPGRTDAERGAGSALPA